MFPLDPVLQYLKYYGRTIHRADYHDILLKESQRLGAKIMLDSEVISIDSAKRQVTLKGGILITGNVIVGADGEDPCLDSYLHNGRLS